MQTNDFLSATSLPILKTSTNEQQLSILEALLIKKKYKPELCTQKQSYTALRFNNPQGPAKENTITRTNFAGLGYSLAFSPSHSILDFPLVTIPW